MYDEGKKLVGYKYLDTDFVKANKECSNCDHHNNYCCFDIRSLSILKDNS